MPRKLVITDLDAFAAKYPHLVKTVPATVKGDNRKIFAAIDLGFPLEGVQVVEAAAGEAEDEEGEAEGAAPAKAAEGGEPPVVGRNDVPLNSEAQAIANSILGAANGMNKTPPAEDVTKGFQRFPGESERTFHQRCREMRAAGAAPKV